MKKVRNPLNKYNFFSCLCLTALFLIQNNSLIIKSLNIVCFIEKVEFQNEKQILYNVTKA